MMVNQALILVGGLGNRLGKITKRIPKPLIKINNLPFIEHLIFYLSKFGIKEIILLTNYKSIFFFKKYHKKKIYNLKIKCIKEEDLLGTSGAVFNSMRLIKKKFLLCNGDTIFDINLFDFFLRFKKNLIGTLACSSLQKNSNRYTKFRTKNKNLVSSGIYLFNKKLIKKYLIKNGSLENDVLSNLPKSKFKKISYEKIFLDIGIKKDLKKASNFLKTTYKKKCIFLDRDGVINFDTGYLFKKKDFIWKKNVVKAIKFLNDNNYYVIVISNQSGIGRGLYGEKDVNRLHSWINKQLNEKGAYIDKFYYSPFYKLSKYRQYRKGANLRKPNVGLFKLATKDFEIIKGKSYFVGDKESDRLAARKFKIKYINVDNETNLYSLLLKELRL
tara:strand:+ start:16784 stop:17941 length:1158 start_codon:yes stop_codon:yes gene_type:complete